MTTLLAWHNDPALKAEVVARMRAHRAADEIVQGLYQLIDPGLASGYKGCLIGCTLPAQPLRLTRLSGEPDSPGVGWHGRVEALYGIPRPVGFLMDLIFEGLPSNEGAHAQFAVASIEAVPVGADLSMMVSRLLLEFLADPDHGVLRHTKEGSDQRAAVELVIGLYERRLAGDEPAREEWLKARLAAYAYASASASAYASAAAYAYASAAAYAAAYAYASAYAYAAADAAWWGWAAQRLLHHLATAPIPALT